MKAQCVRCMRVFEPKQNQKWCSAECRSKASYERQESTSRIFWESIAPAALSPEIASLDERQRIPVLLASQAPPNTRGYRVGAPNRFTPEAKQYLRWFPSAEQQWPALFTLDPFQFPRVPASGIYIVAYFSPEGHIHQGASFKMLIPFFEPRVKWSRGDRKLLLEPQVMVK